MRYLRLFLILAFMLPVIPGLVYGAQPVEIDPGQIQKAPPGGENGIHVDPGSGPGLPNVDEMKKQIVRERYVTFDGESRINNKKFDGKILMPPMQKGTVEMWTVENRSDGLHTFHIHVNPFFVLDIKDSDGNSLMKGKEQRRMRWQDSIVLRPKSPVTFITKFDDFTGKFVIHCHNLKHEDQGMMHAVEII